MSHGAADRYLNVSPVRQVSSAPHSRSCSFKKACRRPPGLDLMDSRPRTNSLPCRPMGGAGRQRHASDLADQDMKDRGDTLDRLCRVSHIAYQTPAERRGHMKALSVLTSIKPRTAKEPGMAS
ncbi:hypothetical protein ACOMHN_032830 [Nucella lapillus]